MDWTRIKHTATVKLKQLTCVQYLKQFTSGFSALFFIQGIVFC